MKMLTIHKNMLRTIIVAVFLGNFFIINSANYVTIKAKNGDGMYTLFKKYNIPATSCNINHFKEINRLKSTKTLFIGNSYNLPILKYNYNGKSIATSIPKIDKSTAQRISGYNKTLHQNKIKKTSYIQGKVLWVVYDALNCNGSISSNVKKNPTVKPVVSLVAQKTKIIKASIVKTPLKSEIKPTNIAPKAPAKKIEDEMLENEAVTKEVLNESKEEISESIIRTRTVPVFGPDFQEIRIENNKLKNKVYYLVSGHGGPDPGTMYNGEDMTMCEDEYAYDITLRLARKLMEQGANVHLIVQDPNDGIRNDMYLKIDKDEKCITGYPLVLNQRLRLTQTTDAVNDLYRKYRNQGVSDKDQICMHIHIDSRHADMRKDVFFYYQEENKYSLALAKNLRRTLDKKYDEISERDYTGTISTRSLFVMRNTIPSTVYLELGNIQNQADQKRFIYSSNRQALAEWLYDGVSGEE